jgi:hypothetical protein
MSAMSQAEYQAIVNRQRRLPEQLVRARLRVRQLENEAVRLGMPELLNDPATLNRAWEREVELARIQGGA